MKPKIYDSRTPHEDCRVLPCPGPKINGLSMTQAAARRKIEFIGVLKPHMLGGPVGLGMRSTVQSCPRMLKATPWRHGPRTPGTKGPRSPKPPKQNPCFYKPIVKGRAVVFKAELDKLEELRRIHLAIAQGKGGARLKQVYRDKRNHFMTCVPNRRYQVREMEVSHQRVK